LTSGPAFFLGPEVYKILPRTAIVYCVRVYR
jgi:hypothetical protein